MFSVHLKLYLSLFQNINPREDTGVNVAANMFPSWKKKKANKAQIRFKDLLGAI